MYQIRVEPKAKKELKKIKSEKDIKRIYQAFLEIRKNPFLGKKLKGEFNGLYSLRIWPYRIVYKIYRQQILVIVVRFSHRSRVYG